MLQNELYKELKNNLKHAGMFYFPISLNIMYKAKSYMKFYFY